ncbi:hypothetical protein FALBO_11112 [Fusarium albosuccineum]|uniref:Fungal N-terminal domain-containing protein n=1 Tax=Fusarium albosuccineum TaxID=1237068 RepID=A0A8H4L5N4_9HYPO|nr:hypothetical protein FALBO_11112 [Fusarium albosuccineum]
MDPLSIFGAVAGGISVTSEIVKALDKAISIASNVKEAPELAKSTLRDVSTMRSTMLRFQTLLNSRALENRPGIYFPLDDAQNAFLGCITSLDELESLIRPLSDPKLKSLDMSERLEWAMKDKRINQLSQRVRDAQLSLVLMSAILQQESLMQVQEAIASLSQICQKIAPSVAHLKRRSADLYVIEHRRDGEDEVDDSSTIRPAPAPRPDSIIVSESMLAVDQLSPQDQIDGTFSPRLSSSHSSLGRVSTISFVALPIFCNDLSNPEHYNFGEAYAAGNIAIRHQVDPNGEDAAIQSNLPPWGRPLPPIPQLLTPPSTPLSPSIPGIIGMSRVLKAAKKAFKSESPTSLSNAPTTPTSPPGPVTPPSESDLWIAHPVLTLEQLSELQMESSEWRLCHGPSGVPCRGAVHESLLKAYSINEVTDEVYGAQIDLAKTNGFLDPFRCRRCKLSLAQIVGTRRPGWSMFELWCGSTGCLDSHSMAPCSCFSLQQEYPGLASEYLGYRSLSDDKVQCARCFSLCPACESKGSTGIVDKLPPMLATPENGEKQEKKAAETVEELSPETEPAPTAEFIEPLPFLTSMPASWPIEFVETEIKSKATLKAIPQDQYKTTNDIAPTSEPDETPSDAEQAATWPASKPRKDGILIHATPPQRREFIQYLYSTQEELLDAQRLLFDETRYQPSDSHLSEDIRRLQLHLDSLRRLRGATEEMLTLLTERQGVLVFRSEILISLWQEKWLEKHSNVFSSEVFVNMCERFDETQERLDHIAKKMFVFDLEVLNFQSQ